MGMSTPLDTSLLSGLHRCDDCGRITHTPKSRHVAENLWTPLCVHCYDQRIQSLERDIAIVLAESIVQDAHALLNAGHSFGPQEDISI